MGYAIAESFLSKGYRVVLVSGPVAINVVHPSLTLVQVTSADEMFMACNAYFQRVSVAVFAAAVADYKPAQVFTHKLKKNAPEINLRLVKNVDIASAFGDVKQDGQLSVGFALETQDEEQNALKKLFAKNFDLIVLNSTRDELSTFGFDTNKVTIIDRDFNSQSFPLKSKKKVGEDIVGSVIKLQRLVNSQIP